MGFEKFGNEIGEIAKQTSKNIEKSIKDIDKRIDIGKNINELTKDKMPGTLKDIDKRIDINIKPKEVNMNTTDKVDIDRRIDEKFKGTEFTKEDKKKLKDETGWSDEIINSIQTLEEAEVLKKANLVDVEINGKKCLIKKDINMKQTDDKGRTNMDRMKQGFAPLDKKGRSIELHHIGQDKESPLAELTSDEHDKIPNYPGSDVHKDENKTNWHEERKEHWKKRGEE